MILLELTEKEAELLGKAITNESYVWKNDDEVNPGKALNEKNIALCDSLCTKLNAAQQPQPDVLIMWKDLHDIVDNAKGEYQKLPRNLRVSNKTVEEADYAKISLANSVIMWLNRQGLLKKLARFDFTDILKQYGG